jgi:hypothetical protein
VVDDELVRELRDRDHENEVEEQLDVVCAPCVAVLERAESRRVKGPQLILPLEDRHARMMRYHQTP